MRVPLFRWMPLMIEDPVPSVSEQTPDPRDPAEKVRTFPTTPGVYLMKDACGNVIYVGKAKNLRSRASSYFSKEAANDARIRDWMPLVKDVDYIETSDAIAAVFTEARMIKELRPRFKKELKEDKTLQYLQTRTHGEFQRGACTSMPWHL